MSEDNGKEKEAYGKTSSASKDELVSNIKEWLKIDNDIDKLKADLKEKNERKKSITKTLVEVMKDNSIDCFDINGGSLVYKQIKNKQSISKKYLVEQLQSFFEDQPDIAIELQNKILDSRKTVVKEEISRRKKKET